MLIKNVEDRRFPVAQWVKDLVLSLWQLRSVLRCGFDPQKIPAVAQLVKDSALP